MFIPVVPSHVFCRALHYNSEDIPGGNWNNVPQVVVKNSTKSHVFLYAQVRKYYGNFERLNNYVVYEYLNSEPDGGNLTEIES